MRTVICWDHSALRCQADHYRPVHQRTNGQFRLHASGVAVSRGAARIRSSSSDTAASCGLGLLKTCYSQVQWLPRAETPYVLGGTGDPLKLSTIQIDKDRARTQVRMIGIQCPMVLTAQCTYLGVNVSNMVHVTHPPHPRCTSVLIDQHSVITLCTVVAY